MKLRTGDKVTVIAGANKGKTGKITKVLDDKVIVEGVRVSSFTSNGRIPMVKMDYKGEVIVRTLDSTAFKEGEKVSVYYNPNRKEESLRAVGKIDNLKYIIVLIISLPIYGAAFLFAFPNLII